MNLIQPEDASAGCLPVTLARLTADFLELADKLADCDPYDPAALAVIQHYHFTELCPIGKSNPTFSYFLVHGQAPRGLMLGVYSTAFRPEQLGVSLPIQCRAVLRRCR